MDIWSVSARQRAAFLRGFFLPKLRGMYTRVCISRHSAKITIRPAHSCSYGVIAKIKRCLLTVIRYIKYWDRSRSCLCAVATNTYLDPRSLLNPGNPRKCGIKVGTREALLRFASQKKPTQQPRIDSHNRNPEDRAEQTPINTCLRRNEKGKKDIEAETETNKKCPPLSRAKQPEPKKPICSSSPPLRNINE